MSVLAINGASPIRTAPFSAWPVHDEREKEAITKVVESGKWWRFAYATGVEAEEDLDADEISKGLEFSRAFARHQQAQYGIAVANGTASLEIIFKALGIGPGDEVIVSAYTYVASATAVLQVNAVPIFVDVDPETYGLDPELIEAAISSRTKAIEPVHFGGQPADMDRILDIAQRHGLFVVEDAAHAHGTEWKGHMVGALGDAGSFSFQSSKNMTAGEGGMIVTNDWDLAERCDSLLWAGREKGRPWYEFHRLGWNYRITEFQAAILLVQLSRLESQNKRRMENARYLNERLAEIEGLTPLKWDSRTTKHSYHIYIVRYDPDKLDGVPRQRFVEALTAEGIPAFYGYTHPVYANPMFLNHEFYTHGCPIQCPHRDFATVDYGAFAEQCPASERACNEEAIWLEHRLLLGDLEDMDDIVDAMEKITQNIQELI